MARADLPAAIEAAELHVQAADGNVGYAAERLRQGWTRRRRPVTNVAKVALPLLALAWLLRKKQPRAPARSNGLYYMGPMQPVKSNFIMGLVAAAVASRAVWIPILSAAMMDMQRRRNTSRVAAEDAMPGSTPAYGYPGTAGTANVGSDPRVEAGYH